MSDERKAIQKIVQCFLKWEPRGPHGLPNCQADKDLMIKYLIQRVNALEDRVHRLETGRSGASESFPGLAED